MREQSAREIRKSVYGDMALAKKYDGGWLQHILTKKITYQTVKAVGLRKDYQAAKKLAKLKPEIAVALVVIKALLKRRKAVAASKERAINKKTKRRKVMKSLITSLVITLIISIMPCFAAEPFSYIEHNPAYTMKGDGPFGHVDCNETPWGPTICFTTPYPDCDNGGNPTCGIVNPNTCLSIFCVKDDCLIYYDVN